MENISSYSKKAQVGNLGTSIIALVIAAVFLILGLVVIQSLRNTDVVTTAHRQTIVNETLTTVAEAGELVACTNQPGANSFALAAVRNATGAIEIVSTNYTFSTTTGRISFIAGAGGCCGFNNSNWIINYSCSYGDQAYSSSNKTLAGLGTFADFWEIIVLAIVISIVIGLLLLVFGGRRER